MQVKFASIAFHEALRSIPHISYNININVHVLLISTCTVEEGWTLCSIQGLTSCAVHYYTLIIIYHTLCSIQYTIYRIHYTLYTMHYIAYNIARQFIVVYLKILVQRSLHNTKKYYHTIPYHVCTLLNTKQYKVEKLHHVNTLLSNPSQSYEFKQSRQQSKYKCLLQQQQLEHPDALQQSALTGSSSSSFPEAMTCNTRANNTAASATAPLSNVFNRSKRE